MTEQLAFLGMGVMGGPMAVNLARRGFPLNIWNLSPEKPGLHQAQQAGATVCDSIQKAVATAGIIFTCLGDVPDVEAVLLGKNGVLDHAKPDSLIVDFSTIGRDAAQHIALRLADRQLRFMDAPVSGGDIGAQQGTLTIMVGGELVDFGAVQPYLKVLGKNIIHCGTVGSGQAVKLCNQVLAGVHMIGLCEAIALAQIQGIDPALMVSVCETGAAGSWALSNLGPKIIADDLEPGFMVQHILKDLRLVQETLVQASATLPGVALAEQQFQQVSQLLNGDRQGTQAMIRRYRSED
ncbi:MAG: NAD(P)-dependent oxidoreductase [Synechocystis sp.]